MNEAKNEMERILHGAINDFLYNPNNVKIEHLKENGFSLFMIAANVHFISHIVIDDKIFGKHLFVKYPSQFISEAHEHKYRYDVRKIIQHFKGEL